VQAFGVDASVSAAWFLALAKAGAPRAELPV